ncbi:MAG: FecR domain-containing protein [bacterium]|nr:FecR domain-containing protein [bacterium]
MVRSILRSLCVLSLVALAMPAVAQERVAQLTRVDGDVRVIRPNGETLEARQVGPRVRNGSLFGGDAVRTGAEAAATLIFSDGSQLKLRAETDREMREIDLSLLVDSGRHERPLGRRIKVLAGEVWSQTVASNEVLTEFETPSGVAAVKGTILDVRVGEDGASSFACEEGEVEVFHFAAGMGFELSGGYGVGWRKENGKRWSFTAAAENPGPLALEVGGRRKLQAVAGSRLSAQIERQAVRLAVDEGVLLLPDGKQLIQGQRLAYANSARRGSPRAPVTIRTDEGLVELSNPRHGLVADLAAGYQTTLSETLSGDLRIAAPDSNPGEMSILQGGHQADLQPGAVVDAATGRQQLEIDVVAGSAVVTEPEGARQNLVPPASGASAGSGGAPPRPPVSFQVQEGQIEITNEAQGVTMTLEAGYGVSLTSTIDGGLEVVTPSSNPGDLVLQGQGSVSIAPGSTVETSSGPAGLEADVRSGSATLTTAAGTQQQLTPPAPPATAPPIIHVSAPAVATPQVSFQVEEGEIEITNEAQGVTMTLDAGFGVSLANTAAGTLEIVADPVNPGDLVVQGEGTINIAPGSTVEASAGDAGLEVEVSAGAAVVTTTDGTTQEMSSPNPPAVPLVPTGTAGPTVPVSIQVDEGQVEVTNDDQGFSLTLDEGFGVSLTGNPDGTLEIVADPANPGDLVVSGNGSVTIAPGSTVEATAGSAGLEVEVTAGSAVVTTPDGTAQPVTSTTPPAVPTAAPAPAPAATPAPAPVAVATDAGTPQVTFEVEEGEVVVTNDDQGVSMTLEEGFGVSLANAPDGSLEIVADPSNPSDLVVAGEGTINIAPGSTVEAATGDAGLEVEVTAGAAVVTTPDGQVLEVSSPNPPVSPPLVPDAPAGPTAPVTIQVDEGQVVVTNNDQGVSMTLDEGFGVSMTGNPDGGLEIVADPGNPGDLVVAGNGSVTIAPGSTVEATAGPAGLAVEVTEGSAVVTTPDGTTQEVTPTTTPAAPPADAGTPPVTIEVEEGEVEVTNNDQGVSMTLDEGFGVSLTGNEDGSLEIVADPSNPGDLVVAGEGTINIAPGSTVEAATGDAGLEVEVTAGAAVVTTPDGQVQEVSSPNPPASPPPPEGSAGPSAQVTIQVEEGQVEVTNDDQGVSMTLDEGFGVSLTGNEDGSLEIAADPGNPGDLVVAGDGSVTIAPGGTVEATGGPDGLDVEVTEGSAVVTTPDGQIQEVVPDGEPADAPPPAETGEGGQVFTFGNPDYDPPSTTPVTFGVEEGQIEIFNEDHGISLTLDAGFGVTLADTPTGDLQIVADPDNPGDLTITQGGQSVTVASGSTVETDSGRQRLDVDVVSGTATVSGPSGEVVVLDEGDSTTGDDDGGEGTDPGDGTGDGGEGEGDDDTGGDDTGGDDTGGDDTGDGSTPTGGGGDDGGDTGGGDTGGGGTGGGGGDDGGEDGDDTGGGDPGDGDPPPGDDDDGDDFFDDDIPELACGECGIPDGFGGCIDVNSLCPDENCLVGRTCSNGQCVGGTAPASGEDPNCP